MLPTLVSIQYWTPYYWGQARWGMLLPALFAWVTDPIANLLVQQLANTLFVFLFPFLLARWLLGPRGWLPAGALTCTLLLLTFPPGSISFVANSLVFPTAGVLGFGALLLFDRGRRTSDAAAWLLWALAWAPSDPDVVYAYRGDGLLLRSLDGGLNWGSLGKRLPRTLSQRPLAVDPLDPSTLVFAGESGPVRLTLGAGRMLLDQGLINNQMLVLYFDPNDPLRLLGGTAGAGLLEYRGDLR
jgi:hypothetical protein